MRLNQYIKEGNDDSETDDRSADAEKIVDMVISAMNKNQINSAVQQASLFYKLYGNEWLSDLNKKLRVDVKDKVVDDFISFVKTTSKYEITHLK